MKKRIIKIVAALFVATALVAAGYVTLLLYPHPLFEHELKIGQIEILSDESIDSEFSEAVKEAVSIISESELYDATQAMGVLLAQNNVYHRLSPGKELAYALGPYVVLAGKIDAGENKLFWDKSPVKMNLVDTIAHELTHCMQGKHHGYFTLNRSMLPWKREGYAEYVAHRKSRMNDDDSLANSLSRLLEPEKIQPVEGWMTAEDGFDYPIQYYRFRLMAEYLFDIERIGYTEFVEEAEFHDAYNRMIAWYKQTTEQDE